MDAFDRLVTLAPLGVLAFALHRNERERSRLLHALEADRESFRNERRELINRLAFPTMMPVASRPTSPLDPSSADARTVPARMSEEQRREWARVGTAAPAFMGLPGLPGDSDRAPGTDDDEAPVA